MDATALFKFQSGLYVVSAATEDDYGACVINTGLQLTSEPLQVMVAVNKQNHTEGVIERAGHFALTPAEILSRSGGLYDGVTQEYPFLAGPERRPKAMVFSCVSPKSVNVRAKPFPSCTSLPSPQSRKFAAPGSDSICTLTSRR